MRKSFQPVWCGKGDDHADESQAGENQPEYRHQPLGPRQRHLESWRECLESEAKQTTRSGDEFTCRRPDRGVGSSFGKTLLLCSILREKSRRKFLWFYSCQKYYSCPLNLDLNDYWNCLCRLTCHESQQNSSDKMGLSQWPKMCDFTQKQFRHENNILFSLIVLSALKSKRFCMTTISSFMFCHKYVCVPVMKSVSM